MVKMSIPNRILLLIAAYLSGYLIVSGIEKYDPWTKLYFTVAFGVLVLACLLLMLFGFEVLNNTVVVLIATVIPLSLSSGIISNYFHHYKIGYLIFAVVGLLGIWITRIRKSSFFATVVLAIVHGLAGLVITVMPVVLISIGKATPRFIFVAAGGAAIGIAGLILAFLKLGKNTNLVSKDMVYRIFPTLLLVVTALFVLGLS